MPNSAAVASTRVRCGTGRRSPRRHGFPAPTPSVPAMGRSSPSVTPTAMRGWSRRSQRGAPVASDAVFEELIAAKEPSMSATVSSTFPRRFRRVADIAASLALRALSAHAAPTPCPADFRSSQVVNADATIKVRVGGHGPAVVLIHGFGNTGDMWSPMAAELAKDHTVVVPDLRGMGLSSHPAGGYDKWTQAGDIRAVLDKLGIDRADIVGHDIGVMVAYAYAARYPDKTSRLVVMDSPVQ